MYSLNKLNKIALTADNDKTIQQGVQGLQTFAFCAITVNDKHRKHGVYN